MEPEKLLEAQEEDAKRSIALLRRLSHDEGFREWRDLCAKPVLGQIRSVLKNPMELTEANIKAQVMYQNLVEALFYGLFDDINQQYKDGTVTDEG